VIITYCLHFLEPLNCLLFMYFCVNLMKEFKILLFYFKNMFTLMFVDFCRKEWKIGEKSLVAAWSHSPSYPDSLAQRGRLASPARMNVGPTIFTFCLNIKSVETRMKRQFLVGGTLLKLKTKAETLLELKGFILLLPFYHSNSICALDV